MVNEFFENVPTAAFMLDGGVIARANLAAGALFGREELVGAELRELFGEGAWDLLGDEDDVRQALVKLIGKLGFDTVGARCVDEAVELARSEHALRGSFDMVLTDLTMPGSQGGLDVVRRVKEIDPDACVVVLSGYAEDPVLRDFRHHGFDAALNKPVGAKELSRVLHALIGVPKGA